MTDEAFNRYLANKTRLTFPAWTDTDQRVELQGGHIVIVAEWGYRFIDDQDRVQVELVTRVAPQIELGLREAVEELTRRSFEG